MVKLRWDGLRPSGNQAATGGDLTGPHRPTYHRLMGMDWGATKTG